jgi:ParB/RepB/Spo0J family partition protein
MIPSAFGDFNDLLGGQPEDFRAIPTDSIEPDPDQPRKVFDDEAIRDLARSISKQGLLEPVVVRPAGQGRWRIVAGERRWRALRHLGRPITPVVVLRVEGDLEALEAQLAENLVRVDLSPSEVLDTLERVRRAGEDPAEFLRRVGLSRSQAWRYARLLDSPEATSRIRAGESMRSVVASLSDDAEVPEDDLGEGAVPVAMGSDGVARATEPEGSSWLSTDEADTSEGHAHPGLGGVAVGTEVVSGDDEWGPATEHMGWPDAEPAPAPVPEGPAPVPEGPAPVNVDLGGGAVVLDPPAQPGFAQPGEDAEPAPTPALEPPATSDSEHEMVRDVSVAPAGGALEELLRQLVLVLAGEDGPRRSFVEWVKRASGALRRSGAPDVAVRLLWWWALGLVADADDAVGLSESVLAEPGDVAPMERVVAQAASVALLEATGASSVEEAMRVARETLIGIGAEQTAGGVETSGAFLMESWQAATPLGAPAGAPPRLNHPVARETKWRHQRLVWRDRPIRQLALLSLR